jgi:hypothetical protein
MMHDLHNLQAPFILWFASFVFVLICALVAWRRNRH